MNALSDCIICWTIVTTCLSAALALTVFSRKVRAADEAEHAALSNDLDQLEHNLRRLTGWTS